MEQIPFHKTTSDWFRKIFGTPTNVQQEAWESIGSGEHTLLSAPTGSGKTLAAFLSAIDDLVKKARAGDLTEETQVLYISPLKALSNDIATNLQKPLEGIDHSLLQEGKAPAGITTAVRTGDTPSSRRSAMTEHPPHILVTTPESTYLLLTSDKGRKLLSTIRTVIVDEVHAIITSKRGSHLALSLERLERVTSSVPQRIGLSATQKPIEKVARFLSGGEKEKDRPCRIIDQGHDRSMDLSMELPDSPLSSVMSNQVWKEVLTRLDQLIRDHDTTIIFVNTRRLAERLAAQLEESSDETRVTAHHGSMSKKARQRAEEQLKEGNLKALVATASLELGIDIGSVDLVCQIGSCREISTFLQRIGRSGHTLKQTPKGRLFPLTKDELVEGTGLLYAVRQKLLDSLSLPEKPLDILAQQLVAETASGEQTETELYQMAKRAHPYKSLRKKEFQDVIQMLAEGFTTRKGKRGALIHHDEINGRIRPRRKTRLTALTAGGAIPDQFDIDVLVEPDHTFIGTVNEDFATESMEGDVFQLGHRSWRVHGMRNGKLHVEDAGDQPPSIPFWFGEAPGRSPELSSCISFIRERVSDELGEVQPLDKATSDDNESSVFPQSGLNSAREWLDTHAGIPKDAAEQVVEYLATGKAALTALPSENTIVLERFFDEAGDMHLVIHAPFGSRMNRAWGLALRKRFCRKFNFELQAAASEDSIVLSLSTSHSFPLEEVFSYLKQETVREVLIQALLDAPTFEIRWRWNASRALAILRQKGGQRVPPQIQRMHAEDLIAQIFPDQLACLENIEGEREAPDHPLVDQTIHDCLHEAMDIEKLEKTLERIEAGNMKLITRDLREPSPLAQEILNARPYAFLDNAPAEERRTNAVRARSRMELHEAAKAGELDPGAIEKVVEEARPPVRSADELHDALRIAGGWEEAEVNEKGWSAWLRELTREGRAFCWKTPKGHSMCFAMEDQKKIAAAFSEKNDTTGENARTDLIRGYLEISGPITTDELATRWGFQADLTERALLRLEQEGSVIRGSLTTGQGPTEWCERGLLARIHRYTLQDLRNTIEPVTPADYMRFLFHWHNLDGSDKPDGPEALRSVVDKMEGFQAQAAAWEEELLPGRLASYDHIWLDTLCLSGQTLWGKLHGTNNGDQDQTKRPIRTTPLTIVKRDAFDAWHKNGGEPAQLSNEAERVRNFLREKGASFFDEIKSGTNLFPEKAEQGLSELVSKGLATSDSFTGLRALLIDRKFKTKKGKERNRIPFTMANAGRWTLLKNGPKEHLEKDEEAGVEHIARTLLKRYGVVSRRTLTREPNLVNWGRLLRLYRKLEARGEIRGGRFIAGVQGEQFALPEVVNTLRRIRDEEKAGTLVSINATDPLNLTGIMTPEKRIPAIHTNRILYRDGVPVAGKEGKKIRFFVDVDEREAARFRKHLKRRPVPGTLRSYLKLTG